MKLPSRAKYKDCMTQCEAEDCTDCDGCEKGSGSSCIHRRKFDDVTACTWIENDEKD